MNLINVNELGERLGVKPSWCYKAAETGKIPSVKVGKYRRFDLELVMAALLEKGDKAAS